ncbi:MAG: hypothetical protein AB4057_06365 [Crocosphaera sp.]
MAQTSLHSSSTTHTQSSFNEDQHLQVLVLEIVILKKQSVSQKGRKLDQLIRCISRSAYLRGKGNYSSNIYDDALNRTLYWVVTHLEEYDPEKGRFMSWVNYRLQKYLWEVKQETVEPFIQKNHAQIIRYKHKLATVINKVGRVGIQSYLLGFADHVIFRWIVLLNYCYSLKKSHPNDLDAILKMIAEASVTGLPLQRINSESLNQLEFSVNSSSPSLLELTRSYIELDPDNLLKVTPKKYPHVTFQKILLERLNCQEWQDIAHRYQVNASSLRTFFQRNLNKFSGHIRQFVEA